MIARRETVRAAVDRALALDERRDVNTAVQAAALALGLTPEVVRQALETAEDEVLP